MAQTLEEFLISLKFGVDQTGYQRFLETVKNIASSINKVAAELVGLNTAVLVFADKMAQVGDRLYWMSQRLGDSVGTIQTTAQAMSTLGMSSSETYANMERFGGWLRSYGPAATGFLRTLGVTAYDTKTAMDQLASTLYARGMRPGMERSQAYAMQMQYLNLFPGLTEQYVRESALRQQRENAMREVAAKVWGSAGAAEGGQNRFGTQSNQMILQFARLEALFTNIAEKMALSVFPAVSKFIDQMIAYGPTLVEIFDKVAKGFAAFVSFSADAVHTIMQLPEGLKLAAAAFLTFPSAISILLSPLGMVIAGFTALFLLMDDYKHYQWDIERGMKDHPHSQFDWGEGGFFGTLKDIAAPIGQFAKDHPWMSGVLGGLGLLILRFRGVAGAVDILKLAILNFPFTLLASLALILHGDTAPLSPEDQDKLNKRTQDEIDKFKQQHGGKLPTPDEINKGYGYTGDVFHDIGQMFRNLWGHISGEDPQEGRRDQHSELVRRRGGTQIASTAADAIAFGMEHGAGSDDSDLYHMLDELLKSANEKLGYIADMLGRMVAGFGFSTTQGGGGGGGDGGGPGGGAGPTMVESVPSTMQGRAAMLMRKVMAELNITQDEAAPIVSGFLRESQGYANISRGGGEGSYQYGTLRDVGLAQWVGSRHQALEAFAKSINMDPALVDTQIKFLHHELQTNPAFRNWLQKLRSSDPEAWGDMYEAGGQRSWFNHGNYIQELRRMNLGGGGGGGNVAFNTNITVNGSSDPHQTARLVAQEVHRVHSEHVIFAGTALA